MKFFEETKQIGRYARTGVLHSRAGDVLTPTFMPDGTRGAVKGLSPEQVSATGVAIVLANTYHLHLAPGEVVIKELGGLHAFANRMGPILTDSGGYQVFSLDAHNKITEEGVHFTDPINGDKHFISPEKSMQIQLDLGADMIVAFDHLVGLGDTSPERVRDAFDRTHRWLERCEVEFNRLTSDMAPDVRPMLFGVVQGGLDLELRKESLRIVQESRVDGIAIGGLSVGETREEMRTVLEALAPLYDPLRPRFLLGVGTPEDLRIAVENGIDMLDCVLPTRNARHATVWVRDASEVCRLHSDLGSNVHSSGRPGVGPWRSADDERHSRSYQAEVSMQSADGLSCSCVDKKVHLTNERFVADSGVIDSTCDCYACAGGFSRAFLRHQFKSGDPVAGSLASMHNLRYLMRICEEYRGE